MDKFFRGMFYFSLAFIVFVFFYVVIHEKPVVKCSEPLIVNEILSVDSKGKGFSTRVRLSNGEVTSSPSRAIRVNDRFCRSFMVTREGRNGNQVTHKIFQERLEKID